MKIKRTDGRYSNEEVEKVFFEEELDKLMPSQKHTPWNDDSASSKRVKTTIGRYDHDEIEMAVAAPLFVGEIDEYDTDTQNTLAKYKAICEEEIHDSENVLISINDSEEVEPKIVLNDFVKKHIQRVTVMMKESIPPQEKINQLVRDFQEVYDEARKLAASKLPSSQFHDLKNNLRKTLKEMGGKFLEAMKQDEKENSHKHVEAVLEDYYRKLENSLDIINSTRRNRLYYLNERAAEVTKNINKKINSFVVSLGNVLKWAKKTFTLENVVSTIDTLSTGISTTYSSITSWLGEKWNHLKNRDTPESEYIAPAEAEVTDLQTHKVERMFAFNIDDRSFENSSENETLSHELDPHWNDVSKPAGLSTKAVTDLLAEAGHAQASEIVKTQMVWEEIDSILNEPLDVEIAPQKSGLSKIWDWVSEKFQALIGVREDEEYIASEEFETVVAAKPTHNEGRMFGFNLHSETSEYGPEEDEEMSSEYANTEEILGNLHLFDHLEHVREPKGKPAQVASHDAIEWKAIAIDEDVTSLEDSTLRD